MLGRCILGREGGGRGANGMVVLYAFFSQVGAEEVCGGCGKQKEIV